MLRAVPGSRAPSALPQAPTRPSPCSPYRLLLRRLPASRPAGSATRPRPARSPASSPPGHAGSNRACRPLRLSSAPMPTYACAPAHLRFVAAPPTARSPSAPAGFAHAGSPATRPAGFTLASPPLRPASRQPAGRLPRWPASRQPGRPAPVLASFPPTRSAGFCAGRLPRNPAAGLCLDPAAGFRRAPLLPAARTEKQRKR